MAVKNIAFILFLACNAIVSYGEIKLKIDDSTKKLLGYPEETYLEFAEEAQQKGYETEEHYVPTEDGYILKIFRITDGSCESYHNVPVLLLHGTPLNADMFLAAGEDAALGYLLAKSCYNVWVGNYRGNNYGRNHTTFNPDNDAIFWNFTLDDYIKYDSPAMIDFVINETLTTKVNIIAYSMGATKSTLLLAEKPEYNDKVGTLILLGPGILIQNIRTPFSLLFKAAYIIQNLNSDYGMIEFLSKDSVMQTVLESLCQASLAEGLCQQIIGIMDTYHEGSLSAETVRVIFSTILMGISIKFGAHIHQWAESGLIAKFDYGEDENLIIYGSETPPEYDLSNVEVPVLIVNAESDSFVLADNIYELSTRLPNATTFTIGDPLWGHFDLVFSTDIPVALYPTLIEHLEAYSD